MPENVSALEVLKIISGLGGASVLALFTVAWLKGWIVTRRELDGCEKRNEQLKAERDEWKDAALRSLNLAELSEGKADRVIDVVSRTVRNKKASHE